MRLLPYRAPIVMVADKDQILYQGSDFLENIVLLFP